MNPVHDPAACYAADCHHHPGPLEPRDAPPPANPDLAPPARTYAPAPAHGVFLGPGEPPSTAAELEAMVTPERHIGYVKASPFRIDPREGR